MRALSAVAALTALSGCAALGWPAQSPISPLVYDPDAVAAAETLVVAAPGAFNTVRMFDPLEDWRADGFALARYRFPGMDGLDLDHRLEINTAAEAISAFVDARPDRPVRLIGYSTGGAVMLAAAARSTHPDLGVAIVSGALGFPDSLWIGMRNGARALGVAAQLGTVDRRRIGRALFKRLLYGDAGLTDPDLIEATRRTVERVGDRIFVPRSGLALAHTEDLLFWTPPPPHRLAGKRIWFFHGTEDPLIPIERVRALAARYPHAAFIPLERHGHLPFVTVDDMFERLRRAFEEGREEDADVAARVSALDSGERARQASERGASHPSRPGG